MDLLDLTLPTAVENLALDEALLLEAESGHGGEVLRLWEWDQPAVVMGSACRLAQEVDAAACGKDGVPILRRASGGGTVLLGRGCLCFSLVLAYDRLPALREVSTSFAFILEQILGGLSEVLPEIEHAGTSDLAWQGRKFSGNAQQRKRTHLLHHGTLLHGFDLPLVSRYLRVPDRQPDYRKGRDHTAFLTNVPCPASVLRDCLCAPWRARTAAPTWPKGPMTRLVHEKYLNPEWIRRR